MEVKPATCLRPQNWAGTGYEFRSTVLGGETVGTMSTSSGSSVVSKSFTVPVVGGELTYSVREEKPGV